MQEFFNWSNEFTSFSEKEFIILLGFCSFFIIIFSAIYKVILTHRTNHFIESFRHKIGTNLLKSFLYRNYSFFIEQNSADLIKTILSEVDHVVGGVYRQVLALFSSIILSIVLLAIIISVNPLLAFFLILLFGVIYFFLIIAVKRRILNLGDQAVIENKNRFIVANEAFSGIKIIKILGRENYYAEKFKRYSLLFSKTSAQYASLTQVPNFLVEAIIFGMVIMTSIFFLHISEGGSDFDQDVIPLLGLYGFSILKLKPAVQSIYTAYSSIRYSGKMLDNIHSEINKETLPETPLTSKPEVRFNFKDKIELENISFKYSENKREILSDVNFKIEKNKTIGIIGDSGSGKTTLVDILMGLLSPTKGIILVDKERIEEINMKRFQKTIGYVPQEIFLSDSSIKSNIALGVPENEINFKKVAECARLADISNFINSLENKYDSQVGERGVRISGGQRQRIGIARALYNDPEILILDEATSALDNETEGNIMNSINALKYSKTIIIVAHRFSTLKECDLLLRIENGRLYEIEKDYNL